MMFRASRPSPTNVVGALQRSSDDTILTNLDEMVCETAPHLWR
jgi:hypothetical protein